MSPPFPARDVDVAMIPGLLPIFLHGCEIKSGSGLGTRLVEHDDSIPDIANTPSTGRWVSFSEHLVTRRK